MNAFGQIDYVGDACIRLLAKHYCPQKPDKWNKRFGRNSFLEELYFAVAGKTNPPKLGTHPKENKTHLRASHVEAWLGTAFEYGGIDEVIMYWERLIKLWKEWKQKKVQKFREQELQDVIIAEKLALGYSIS